MLMILPTTLLLGALGYLFYTSKKEPSLDHLDPIEKENDDLYKDLEDLFIWIIHLIIKNFVSWLNIYKTLNIIKIKIKI